MARKKADPILEDSLFEENSEMEMMQAGDEMQPDNNMAEPAPEDSGNAEYPSEEESGAYDDGFGPASGDAENAGWGAEMPEDFANAESGEALSASEHSGTADYDVLMSEVSGMALNGPEEERPLTLPEGDELLEMGNAEAEPASDDAAAPDTGSDGPPPRRRRPGRPRSSEPRRDERILTIDAHDEVQSEVELEATRWHEVQNAYRTHRIVTGTLDSVERTESGMTVAVVSYNGYRVAIPLKEMLLYSGRMPSGHAYDVLMIQLNRNLNARLGSEIDFMIKGIENKSRTIVASRKDAMYRKRQTFYMDTNEFGEPMIYEGRVVQARVVAVAEKIMRVEVFGVECAIRAPGMSWMWIGNARDHYNVGDRVLVRVLHISKPSIEDLRVDCDIRSVSSVTSADNLSKCVVQGRYAGRVTDVRGGVVFIRLNNGVNAVAHSCYDARTPGKKDDVSFAVTRLDEEQGVAHGLITRIIRQNI